MLPNILQGLYTRQAKKDQQKKTVKIGKKARKKSKEKKQGKKARKKSKEKKGQTGDPSQGCLLDWSFASKKVPIHACMD